MNDRLLARCGKEKENRELRCPGKGKERQIGQCTVRVGEALAVRFTVNGRSGQAVRIADGRAREVADNGQ